MKDFKTFLKESREYDEFFMKALKKYGVDEPDELDKEEKKAFFDYIDQNWKSEKEKKKEKEE